jgi:signal peptidase I
LNPGAERKSSTPNLQAPSTTGRVWREVLSWFWVIVAFILIEGTVAQARMIPSGSMENTLLVGDHLIVSPAGYDAGVPFTNIHMPLWRKPRRQEILVIRSIEPDSPDLIKRVIGIPGDRIKIVRGQVFVNGVALDEPHAIHLPGYANLPSENFPADAAQMEMAERPEWLAELRRDTLNGELVVPKGDYFMMGDNRDDSNDSRYWGFVPRENVIGPPLMIYMSIDAPDEVWQPGHTAERFETYLGVLVHPSEVRWRRLLHTF